MSVAVLGGCVLDVAYRASNKQTTTEAMQHTSTPCELLFRAIGGVGRNIATTLRAVLDPTAHPLHFVSAVGDDSDGGFLIEQCVVDATVSRPMLARRVAQLRRSQEGPAAVAASPSELKANGIHVARLSKCTTATYTALLDGHGELAAAAAAMDIFESRSFHDHIVGTATQLLARKGPEAAVGAFVLDGNLTAEITRDVLCAIATAASAQRHDGGAKLHCPGPPLVVLDPISTAKALRVMPVLLASPSTASGPHSHPTSSRLVSVFKPNHIEAAAMCKILLEGGAAPTTAVALRAAATNWATFTHAGGGSPLIQAALGASASPKAAQRLTAAMVDAITLASHLRQVRSMLLTCGSAGTIAAAWIGAEENPFATRAAAAAAAAASGAPIASASAWVHVASLRADGTVAVSDGAQEEPAAANVVEHLWIRVFAPARPRKVARVTGAGDAFLGAALSSLLRDAAASASLAHPLSLDGLARAVAFGTVAAAVVLETENIAQVRAGLIALRGGAGAALAKL